MSRFEKIHGENYITGDIESPLAKVKMDIHEIPFEDNSFDVVFCNHVLEHVNDDRKAVSEIKRVLKPGGWAILQIPFFHPIPEKTFEDITIKDPKKREELFGQDDHVRMFGKDYPNRLAESGLTVIEEKLVFEMPREEVKKYALSQDEIIYRVEKV